MLPCGDGGMWNNGGRDIAERREMNNASCINVEDLPGAWPTLFINI